ncbi:hypothetical protein [Candidatus Lokiarchaeum ossiferum]|uniref:hypothetical protein n=1 Tax=Candidatus Lokiarchaeum ossiferum TaxID=2951803 RepID=UPI00352C5960
MTDIIGWLIDIFFFLSSEPTKSKTMIGSSRVKNSCQICPKCGSVNPVRFKKKNYKCKYCKSANKNTDFISKSK